jgi:hypothetical protein
MLDYSCCAHTPLDACALFAAIRPGFCGGPQGNGKVRELHSSADGLAALFRLLPRD